MSDLKWRKGALADDERMGSFVNAFRVSDGPGTDCFLDFLLYSAIEERAVVVARVRVDQEFLPTVCGRLDEVLFDIADWKSHLGCDTGLS